MGARKAESETRSSAGGAAGWRACECGARPPLGVAARCVVAEVVDGDTLEVEIVRRVRVRLLGCWAPESRSSDPAEKRLGQKAKFALAGLALGKRGTVFVPTAGAEQAGDVTTLGRVLAHVWIDGSERSLSEQLVEAGVAASRKGGELGT